MTLSSSKAKEMLRDGTANGKKLTKKQKRYFGMVAGGKANSGASITQLSDNPTSSGIFRFNGPSHEEGGIPIQYANQGVEVEGDETGFIDNAGDLTVFGNMMFPGTKTKFKNVAKEIAKKEESASRLFDKSMKLINKSDPYDRWERLTFNSGTLMASAAQKRQEDLTAAKEGLALLQQSMLEADLAKFETAANGTTIGDPTKLYNDLKAAAEAKLKALYPGKNVRITDAGERDIRTQRGLKGRGASKTSVSLHNFGGARDYLIYVDDKLIQDPAIYKDVIQAPAKALGLHTLGDWDPGHVGLVQEGKGNPFQTLMKQYPELRNTDRYKDSVAYLQDLANKGQADAQELRALNQLTGSKVPTSKAARNVNYRPIVGSYFGENPIRPNIGTSLPPMGPPQTTPIDPNAPLGPPSTTTTTQTTVIPPSRRPSFEGMSPVPWTQIVPEMAALFDEPDFVPGQRFDPKLFQPYQVTFQDRLNENNASFRAAAMQMSGNNASALSVLAGQKYMADSQVLADEFRTNQGITNDITNKNIALLNDAQLQNLQLADTQFVRQEQAKSNTRANVWNAANSISNKIAQHNLENKQFNAVSSMFPQYKFDRYGNLVYIPNTEQSFGQGTGTSRDDDYYQRTRQEYGATGELRKTVINTPSDAEKMKIDAQNWNNDLKRKTTLKSYLQANPLGRR